MRSAAVALVATAVSFGSAQTPGAAALERWSRALEHLEAPAGRRLRLSVEHELPFHTQRGERLSRLRGTLFTTLLELPEDEGLPFSLAWRTSEERSDAAFREPTWRLRAEGRATGGSVALFKRVGPGAALRVQEARDRRSFDMPTDLLGGTCPALGADPPLRLTLPQSSRSWSVEQSTGGGRWIVDFERVSVDGGLAAAGAAGARLRLPLPVQGDRLTLLWRGSAGSKGHASAFVSRLGSLREAAVEREQGREIGRGSASFRHSAVGASWTRTLRSGGRLELHTEWVWAALRASGFIPRAADAGLDAPPASSASYRALLQWHVREAGVRYTIPQPRGQEFDLSYRHAWAEGVAEGSYLLSFLVFGSGASDRAERSLHLGVFEGRWRLPLAGTMLELSMRQAIPYPSGRSGAGSLRGGRGRAEGGWKLGLSVTRPL